MNKLWAQFYDGNRPVLGSDGIMPIDSRLGWFKRGILIQSECKKRGWTGYSLIRGNLMNGVETGIIPVDLS